MSARKVILKKTGEVGALTLLSKLLGIVREFVMVRYLGAGPLSDAFNAAYAIPNSLRKIFAEGALSAAFVPSLIQELRSGGRKAIGRFMTLGFLLFQGLVVIVCLIGMQAPRALALFCAPGFEGERLEQTITMLRILMPFLFFVSSSSILAGALQSIGHFFIPALSQSVMNVVFIGSLLICLTFGLPVEYLCWFILLMGGVQLLLHTVAYFFKGLSFESITLKDVRAFLPVLNKCILACASMGVVEIGLIIDKQFASFLPPGSPTILSLANRFMGIPLSVFGTAFSTVWLPHLSRTNIYAPKRSAFYLLEGIKLMLWVTIPVSLWMAFFSHDIFYTLFLSDKFSLDKVLEGARVLRYFIIGLAFFSANKVLLDMYYTLHSTGIPAGIVVLTTATNIGLNYLLMPYLASSGLALATVCATALQTSLLCLVLRYYFGIRIYLGRVTTFLMHYLPQVILFGSIAWMAYHILWASITLLPETAAHLLQHTVLLWCWVSPLALAHILGLYFTRRLFGIRLYFFD